MAELLGWQEPPEGARINRSHWQMQGLVLWLRMNESAWNQVNNDVIDWSGYGNHGTAYNGATTALGKFGRAGYFDGSNDYVRFSDSPLGLPTGSTIYTVIAWFMKIGSFDEVAETIVSLEKMGLYNRLEISSTLGIVWYFYDGLHYRVGQVPCSINTWYHAVGIRANNLFSLYINGLFVGSASGDGSYPAGVGLNSIGNRNTIATNYYFNGLIDEVRIYNRALSAWEVEYSYRNPNACIDAGGLIVQQPKTPIQVLQGRVA